MFGENFMKIRVGHPNTSAWFSLRQLINQIYILQDQDSSLNVTLTYQDVSSRAIDDNEIKHYFITDIKSCSNNYDDTKKESDLCTSWCNNKDCDNTGPTRLWQRKRKSSNFMATISAVKDRSLKEHSRENQRGL